MGAYVDGDHVSMVPEDWLCLVATDWADDGYLPSRCIYVTLWSGRVGLMRVAENWRDLGTWGSDRQLFAGSNERRAHAMFLEHGMLCKATSIGFSLACAATAEIEVIPPG